MRGKKRNIHRIHTYIHKLYFVSNFVEFCLVCHSIHSRDRKKLSLEDECTVGFVTGDIVAGGATNRLDKVKIEFS